MSSNKLSPRISQVLTNRDQLGETPLWCGRTDTLWWLDIEQPRLQSYHPASGTHQVYPFDCDWLGSLALTTGNEMLVATDLSLQLFDPNTGESTLLVELEKDLDNRLNDGRVDNHGRFWVGSMDNGLSNPSGSLYRIDANGQASTHHSGIVVTNGIVHSPDGRTMYLTDTRRYTTWAFDVDQQNGTLSGQRVFADYSMSGDRPDGAIVDVDGCIWQAFFGGSRIVRYTPAGVIDQSIELPVSNPTCLCFGGTDLRTLFVTTAFKFLSPAQLAAEPMTGSLLAIEGVGQGLPEHRYRAI